MDEGRPAPRGFPWHRVVLFALLAICAGTRFWGIGHDLPHSYYPDEFHFVKRSVAFGSKDLNPHWFHKPAFFMYVLFFEYGLLYCFEYITGAVRGVNDFANRFVADPSSFLMLGRVTSALFGMGGVYLAYRVGSLAASRWVGIGAAAFLTATFAHNVSSMEVKADLACTFFSLLSFFFLMRLMKRGRWRDATFAGMAAGLGMATKYYSVFLFGPMVAATLLSAVLAPRGIGLAEFLKRAISRYAMLLWMTVLFFVFFFLGSPYNYLDPQWYDLNLRPMIQNRFAMLGSAKVLAKMFHLLFGGDFSRGSLGVTALVFGAGAGGFLILSTALGVAVRRIGLGGARGLGYAFSGAFVATSVFLAFATPHFSTHLEGYVTTLVDTRSAGAFLAALGLGGLLFLILRSAPTDVLVLSAIFSFTLIANFYLHQAAESRHLHSLYPLLGVAAASGFAYCVPRAIARKWKGADPGRAARGVSAVLFAAALVPGMIEIVRWNRIQSRDDTRTLALRWIESNIAVDSRILVDNECVKLAPNEATIQKKIDALETALQADETERGASFEGGHEPFLVHRSTLHVSEMQVARDRRILGMPTFELTILEHPWWSPTERLDGEYNTKLDRDIGNPIAIRRPEAIEVYRDGLIEYIVTESARYNKAKSEQWRKDWPSFARFYEELGSVELLKEIPADPSVRPGPTIRIYTLK